jgi:tetratricopeptide (TPR) repeat protein
MQLHRILATGLLLLLPGFLVRAADADMLVKDALAAEARLDSRGALDLFLAADKVRPNDVFILQKIARQYSDLAVDLPTEDEKRKFIENALAYAQRAVDLDPKNAVGVLSLAVCHGKLAEISGTRDKVRYSRLEKEEAERALVLDPDYAWAHHVVGRWNCEVASLGAGARFFVKLFYGGLPDATVQQGIEHLRRAVALEPGQLEHHLELGLAYLAAGQKQQARASIEKGLAMPSREKHDEAAKARAREALAQLDG